MEYAEDSLVNFHWFLSSFCAAPGEFQRCENAPETEFCDCVPEHGGRFCQSGTGKKYLVMHECWIEASGSQSDVQSMQGYDSRRQTSSMSALIVLLVHTIITLIWWVYPYRAQEKKTAFERSRLS